MQPENKLRVFEDLDDLFDHNETEEILKWVNELALLKEKQRHWGKRWRTRNAMFVKVAREMLGEDEKEIVERSVEEKMEGE
jgi:hypothetical protein